jgi:putative aldouronate transport system permease protein
MEATPAVKAPPKGPVFTSSTKKTRLQNYFRRYWTLYLLLLPPLIYFVIFRHYPLLYLQMAIKDFKYNMSIWEMPWAINPRTKAPDLFYHFKQVFADRNVYLALRNTVTLNVLDLLVGFPAPIILALLLNELKFLGFKKITQTISYMPHFLSWIIIASLATQLFAPNTGLVNVFLKGFSSDPATFTPIPFLNNSTYWVGTYVFLGVWQNLGWGSIIYLAAMTGINPELYEAASVDGASRFRKIWHITLPGIRPTIVVLLILAIGGIVASNFDRPFALRNTLVYDVSDVLAIYTYNNMTKYSFATAVGLFASVVNVFFLLSANALAKKFGERGVW